MIDVMRLRPAAGRGLAPAVTAVELALVAAAGVLAALLVWTLAAPESAVPVPRTLAPAVISAAGTPVAARDRSILWRINPFAESSAAPVQQAAPETTLNLSLFGARTAVADAPATAYIKTPDGRQGAYREGQEIISGVTLDRVMADHVSILRGGVRETLYLDGARRPDADAPAASINTDIQPAPGAVFNAEDVYAAAEYRGVMRQGRLAGLRIEIARNPDLLTRTGLAEGDIIVSMDGVPAAELGGLADAFEGLEDAESVDLVIERDGLQHPLTIDFGKPDR